MCARIRVLWRMFSPGGIQNAPAAPAFVTVPFWMFHCFVAARCGPAALYKDLKVILDALNLPGPSALSQGGEMFGDIPAGHWSEG